MDDDRIRMNQLAMELAVKRTNHTRSDSKRAKMGKTKTGAHPGYKRDGKSGMKIR